MNIGMSKPVRGLALLLSLLVCAAALAQSTPRQNDWVLLGPEGGDTRSLAYDPHDVSRVFLGTSAGERYLSRDGGANWARFAHLGVRNDYVLDHIVIDPASSNLIYVAAWSIEKNSGDLFRSRDGGRTWQALPGMHGKSIRAFTLAPSNSRVLVAGALDGVFRSDDAGETWRQVSPPHHGEIKNIESLALDPRTPDIVYAGTWHLPWKTSDGGQNWHSIKQGMIDDSDVFSIIIDPRNPSVVYTSACSGIYKSENAGELFHKIQGIPFSARRTRVLQQDPTNSDIVYAGTTEGLWKSTDAGKSWRRMTAPNLIVNDVLVDPHRPAHVLLATDRSGILASNDGAQTVFASNHGFAHRQVAAVLADRDDPNTIYAGVVNDKEFGGVFVSRDAGAHWTQLNAGLAGHDIFALAQAEKGELIAGTNKGVFLLAGKPPRWSPINLVLNEKVTTVSTSVPHSKKNKVATRRELIRSEMKGRVAQLAVAGQRWFAATSSGVYASVDQGHSWRGGQVFGSDSFVSIDALGEVVAAATSDRVIVSADAGRTWNRSALPQFVTPVYGVALTPSALWIATRQGAFRSSDKGITWEHVVAEIPAKNLFFLRYDASPQRLLGVTGSGEIVWTHDGGQSWVHGEDPGWDIRRVSVAGERLLGITAFSGIVAQPEAARLGASVGVGSSQ